MLFLQAQVFDLAKVWKRFKENMAYIAMLSDILNRLKQYDFNSSIILKGSGSKLKELLRACNFDRNKTQVRNYIQCSFNP